MRVRPARRGEGARLAQLMYDVSPAAHDRLAGGSGRALRLIEAAFECAGTSASAEVTRVAEVDARPAGVMCAFPVWEGPARAREYMSLALAQAPLWRRPLIRAFLARMQRATPHPPREALYVDALGTAPQLRRRGVGRALLADADQQARRLGLVRIGLETETDNEAARSLYETQGFVAGAQGRRMRGLPRYVSYVRELGAA